DAKMSGELDQRRIPNALLLGNELARRVCAVEKQVTARVLHDLVTECRGALLPALERRVDEAEHGHRLGIDEVSLAAPFGGDGLGERLRRHDHRDAAGSLRWAVIKGHGKPTLSRP